MGIETRSNLEHGEEVELNILGREIDTSVPCLRAMQQARSSLGTS